MKKILSFLFKALNIFFLVLSLSVLITSIFFPEKIVYFLKFIEYKISFLGDWNYIIAFVVSVIESFPFLGTLVPGQQLMVLVGGFFGKEHLLLLMITVAIGACIGNYIGYILGAKIGEKWLAEYGIYVGLGKTEITILKNQMEKNGKWFIVLGKFNNVTRAFLPFIAGMSGMKTKSFWAYNIAGSVLWSIVIIILGVLFAETYQQIVAYLPKLLILIMVITFLYFYFFRQEDLKKYWADKEKEFDSL